MITRTLKQVKVFDIKTAPTFLSGHGFCDNIPGKCYVIEQFWESDIECNNLLKEAIKNWEKEREENPWGTSSEKPTLNVYWKTIKEERN